MKKNLSIILIGAVTVIAVVVICLVAKNMDGISKQNTTTMEIATKVIEPSTKETQPESTGETGTWDANGNDGVWYDEEEVSTAHLEDSPSGEKMGGDAAKEQDPKLTFKPDYGLTRDDLVAVCVSAGSNIPYKYEGRYYGKGYKTSGSVAEGEQSEGLDSLGYIIWVYRQLQGKANSSVAEPVKYYDEHKESRVTGVEKLQIGDIGMLSVEKGQPNTFGIYIGLYNGCPVFSLCSNIPNGLHAYGSTGISYLASVKDDFLNGCHSVDFQYFVRPNIDWKEG